MVEGLWVIVGESTTFAQDNTMRDDVGYKVRWNFEHEDRIGVDWRLRDDS